MLERTIEAAVDVDRAFGIWTEQASSWWPHGHSVSQHPGARMSMEARMGGRLLERVPDGPEIVWGRITTWQKPSRIVLAFSPGGGGEYTSEVEVRFEAQGSGTRVTLNHRLGQFTPDRWASMVGRFEANWDSVLLAFARFAPSSSIPTGSADDTFF
jgi:hypothetical protein